VSTDTTDAFLRWNVRPGCVLQSWHVDGTTGLLQVGRRGVPTLTAVGRPELAARILLDALEGGSDVRRVTLPRGTLELLPDALPGGAAIGDGADWDWMWTTDAPPVQPREDEVEVLPADAEHDRLVAELLDAASPRTSARPGDPQVRTWWGVRANGHLVACGANTEIVDGVPHLAGIAVLPSARGQGLGGAVSAAATRAVLAAGAPVCTLGMYADNGAARAVYARLGFRCQHRFSSRAVSR
jgi:ribosomal protein S18 acetylase RimI-like enzyme